MVSMKNSVSPYEGPPDARKDQKEAGTAGSSALSIYDGRSLTITVMHIYKLSCLFFVASFFRVWYIFSGKVLKG